MCALRKIEELEAEVSSLREVALRKIEDLEAEHSSLRREHAAAIRTLRALGHE
jgi:hypothetical protein